MQPSRIFETALYAEDLAAAERFYHQALGLEVIGRGELFVVFRCGGGVLLVFDPRKSAAPGRDVPSPRDDWRGAYCVRGKARGSRGVEGAIASGCNPHRA